MNIDFESLNDLQKRAVEARLRANEDPELRHRPLAWVAKDRRGYALVKTKFQTALGLDSREAGWLLDNMPTADFGGMTAAATQRELLTNFPLFNPSHVIGSIDPEPFELSTLTAVTGDRQVGTSSGHIAILLGCYITHITAAAGVFQPAATTVNIRVISSNGATAGAFTTLATLVVNTATNFVDQIPITATTGRIISITGTTVSGVAGLFNGDSLFAELVAGASLQTNIVAVTAELV
jgi:hypothetical protein